MEPEDVLTKDEIDTLLDGVEEISEEASSNSRGEIQPYDLLNPAGARPHVLPRLASLIARSLDLLAPLASRTFNAPIEIAGESPVVQSFQEATAAIEPPALFGVVTAPPLDGEAVVYMDASLVDACVDALFGGTGRPTEREDRVFSGAEQRIAGRVTELVFAALRGAGGPFDALEVESLRVETEVDNAAICELKDYLVAVRVGLKFANENGGIVGLLIPDVSLEPLRDQLDGGGSATGEKDPTWPTRLRDTVGEADVRLQGRFSGVRLALRDVLKLAPGDFIPLDSAENLTVYAEELPVLKGQLGTHAGRHAVRITETPSIDEPSVH